MNIKHLRPKFYFMPTLVLIVHQHTTKSSFDIEHSIEIRYNEEDY